MIQFAHIRSVMKENYKISKYQSGNKKTETYKDAYVKEMIL